MAEKNQEKKAVALRYRRDHDRAPRVVAAGKGELARRIIAAAREYGVPLYEDQELVSLLLRLTPGTEVPPELYRAVAEVLVFIYGLDRGSKSL